MARRKGAEIVIVETKFTANQLQQHHGSESVRSDHLYQLFAYLLNAAKHAPHRQVEGILLYPRTGRGPDVRCALHGHNVRVTTLNLNQEWQDVEKDLLALLDERLPR